MATTHGSAALGGSEAPLATCHDVALLDLDGVIYLGQQVVPGAQQALEAARGLGMRLAFVTNNAARPPAAVAAHLQALGVPADPADVINSAQAAAHYLVELLPAGARVLVIGTVGLDEALHERGLTPCYRAEDDPAAVVQGFSNELTWAQLAEGMVAIRRGVPWVATNLDRTVPSPRGPLPGNGSLVAALRHATGVTPVVTGKPEPTMHRESVQRSGAQRPLIVGDRLDTDIEGANNAGCPSLLVFSGVTTPRVLLAAPPRLRPDYLAHDVGGLLLPHSAPACSRGRARCGGWSAALESGSVHLNRITAHRPQGPADDIADDIADDPADDLDALRALCALSWCAHDRGELLAESLPRAADAPARAALQRLGLQGSD